MLIEIKDYGEVAEIEPNIEGDGIYTISIVFINGDVLAYGYADKKRFMGEYADLQRNFRRFVTNGH